MIYLFANENFGWPFLLTARDFQKKYKVKIIVILSGISDPKLPLLLKIIQGTQIFLKKISFFLLFQMSIYVVQNINSPSFYKKITPGSHGIILGFNQIFVEETIRQFNSVVNFHPSVLPLYRGPVPSYWCIKNKETKTGYTLHVVTNKIDSGKILFQEEIEIENGDTPKILDQRIASLATKTFRVYLEYIHGNIPWKIKLIDSSKIYHSTQEYFSFPNN